jgi:hypothetical protein
MTYKNLSQAQQKLALAEARYNKQNFANVREEKLQVAEIDRIKRNIAKLAKYLPLLEERKTLESAIKEIRLNIRVCYLKMAKNSSFSRFVQKCAQIGSKYMIAVKRCEKSRLRT